MDSDHLKSKTLAALDALQAELDREAAAKKFVEDSLANKNQGGVIQVPASRKVCLPHPVDENGAELPWVHPAEALYFGKSFINYVPTDDEDFFECENPIQAGLRDLANDWEKAGQSNFANDLRACIPGEPREGVPSDVPACLEKIQKVRTALQGSVVSAPAGINKASKDGKTAAEIAQAAWPNDGRKLKSKWDKRKKFYPTPIIKGTNGKPHLYDPRALLEKAVQCGDIRKEECKAVLHGLR